MKEHIADRKRCLPETGLYCLTAEALSCGRGNIEVVRKMIAGGVKIIQYREKEKSGLEKYKECMEIREMTRAAGVTFIVNDDVGLAQMVKADGVHVGQDDTPVEAIRALVGDEMILGLSTHAPEEARRAQASGLVDYIGVGPIYSTQTKKDVCDPVGYDYLEYVVEHMAIPFVAIGGIKIHNLHEITSRGAGCIAMVSEITAADDIEAKIKTANQKIGETYIKRS